MDVKNYDYIVVGGGSAGSVVTSKLIKDKNASVLLLEVGKSDSPPLVSIPAGFAVLIAKGLFIWPYLAKINNNDHFCPSGKGLVDRGTNVPTMALAARATGLF